MKLLSRLVGSEFIWLWRVAIPDGIKEYLHLTFKRKKHMSVAPEKLLPGLTKVYDTRPIFNRDGGTWYPLACKFLKLNNHIHSSYLRKASL